MKNFDDLSSIWEDFSATPYLYTDQLDITLMTRGDEDLVIDIFNKEDEEKTQHEDLINIEIIPFDYNNFKIKYINRHGEVKFLNGEHPINGNENVMILELPKLGKRYFEKKSGNNYSYKKVIL